MPKITKRVIDGLRPSAERDTFAWDSELRGFGVRMKPSGSAAFLVQYRNAAGETRRMAVGKVGTLTPDEARRLARERLAAVARGLDPSAERHASREAMTVAELCRWYLDSAKAGSLLGQNGRRIKASTLAMDASRVATHVVPLIGNKAVRRLTVNDIETMQAAIAAGRTARSRIGRGGQATGGNGAAARTTGMLRTIFEHAKRKQLIADNPAEGARPIADRKRDRRMSADELKALGRAIREAEANGENRTGIAAIRLLVMTGLRRAEVLSMKWSWIDLQSKCVRFPDTKSGAQARPLGRSAIDSLRMAMPHPKTEWVFPADRGNGHFVGVVKVLDRLCRDAGLDGITPHVLRHTFASVAAEHGFTELTIAGLLGHKARGVTQRYVHLDAALTVAADQVSYVIAEMLGEPTGCGHLIDLSLRKAAAS